MRRAHGLRRRPRRSSTAAKVALVGAAALAAAGLAHRARATSDFWSAAGNGNWNVAGNWSAGVPTAGQDVFITNAGTKTVTYVNPGFTNAFLSLTLDDVAAVNTL